MKKQKEIGLDFEIDKLTDSIENVNSGDRFLTEISLLTTTEVKELTKKNGWQFNWSAERRIPARDVYKLTIIGNSNIIQGAVSLEVKPDHVYMHLIECTVQYWKRQDVFRCSRQSGGLRLSTILSAGWRRLCFFSFQNQTD